MNRVGNGERKCIWVIIVVMSGCLRAAAQEISLGDSAIRSSMVWYEDAFKVVIFQQGACKFSACFSIPKDSIVQMLPERKLIEATVLHATRIPMEVEYLYTDSYANIDNLIPYHYTMHKVRYSSSMKIGNLPLRYQIALQSIQNPIKNTGIDATVEFDNQAMQAASIDEFREKVLKELSRKTLDSIGTAYSKIQEVYTQQKQSFNSGAFTNLENELLLYALSDSSLEGLGMTRDKIIKRLSGKMSMPSNDVAAKMDSLQRLVPREKIEKKYQALREIIVAYKDSMQKLIEVKADSIKTQYKAAKILIDKVKQPDLPIDKKELEALVDLAKQYQVADSATIEQWKHQYDTYHSLVKQLRLGTTQADYSELTVKNLTLRGAEAEIGERVTHKATVGVINWDFRSNNISPLSWKGNFFSIYRLGLGRSNARIYLSAFMGEKGEGIAAGGNKKWVSGFSLMKEWRISEQTFVIAEFAKSNSNRRNYFSNKMPGLGAFDERSNEAYALKVQTSLFRSTGKLYAGVRYINKDFESFSMWTPGTRQVLWNVGAEKTFFRQQLRVSTQHKSLQYNTPFQGISSQSTSILSSYMLSFRKRHLPSLVVAYYPNNTIYRDESNGFHEIISRNLSIMAAHFYTIGKEVQQQEMITYTGNTIVDNFAVKLYNKFSSLAFTHHTFFKGIDLSAAHTLNQWDSLHQQVSELTGAFPLGKLFYLTAGAKYFNYNRQKNSWGLVAGCTFNAKRLGRFYFNIERTQIYAVGSKFIDNNNFQLQYSYSLK